MSAVRWILSVLVAGAIGFPAWIYFVFRLAGDSSGGSAYDSIYAADIVVVALTLAATIGVLVALIHDRGRFRNLLLVATLLLLGGSVLSLRELQWHKAWDGHVLDTEVIPALSSAQDVGFSERTCFEADTFQVEIRNPETQRTAKIFRGVWPWSFETKELDRLFQANHC